MGSLDVDRSGLEVGVRGQSLECTFDAGQENSSVQHTGSDEDQSMSMFKKIDQPSVVIVNVDHVTVKDGQSLETITENTIDGEPKAVAKARDQESLDADEKSRRGSEVDRDFENSELAESIGFLDGVPDFSVGQPSNDKTMSDLDGQSQGDVSHQAEHKDHHSDAED